MGGGGLFQFAQMPQPTVKSVSAAARRLTQQLDFPGMHQEHGTQLAGKAS